MSYIRLINSNRGPGIVSIPGIDEFHEVRYRRFYFETIVLPNKVTFNSFHHILDSSNDRIMTAFKSESEPETLLIIWKNLPYTHHIEQGGDLMLQEIQRYGLKNLIIDNTYVKSMWMNSKMKEYFHRVWYPSLIELGLENFIHIESTNSLGGVSFNKFKENITNYLQSFESTKPIFKYTVLESKLQDTLSWTSALEKAINLTK